jgi:hypothetical protein
MYNGEALKTLLGFSQRNLPKSKPYDNIICAAATMALHLHLRVARWYIFKPKNTNLGIFWSAS